MYKQIIHKRGNVINQQGHEKARNSTSSQMKAD